MRSTSEYTGLEIRFLVFHKTAGIIAQLSAKMSIGYSCLPQKDVLLS